MNLTNDELTTLRPNRLVTAVIQQYDSNFSQVHTDMFGTTDYRHGGPAHNRALEIIEKRREELDWEVSVLVRAYRALEQEGGNK
jgi:hypothetical protein